VFFSRTVSCFLVLAILTIGMSTVRAEEAKQDIPFPKIAKAVIAKVMGRDPVPMKVKEHKDPGVYHVSYVRENDKTKWACLVKFEGNVVIWATAGSPSAPNVIGRWRDHSNDGVLTYEIKGDNVKITEKYGDGSQDEITFSLSTL